MKKLMTAMVVAACAANALAMPTKAELTKAQPLVAELMAPAMAEFKAAAYKEKPAAAVKVGDASSEFAKAAETEAAKFLLLKGAVSFYVRGEQYDKAADTVAALRREVKDVPPEVVAEITSKATGTISETKAPRLYALYRSAKLQVRAADEAKALAQKLKKVKSDALQRKYAEALAVSGNWKAAYAEFAKVSDAKLKAVVEAEAAGKAKSAESGEFWWGYRPMMDDADDFFKSHAAAYYRKALDAGEITGLKKNLVEQRIKDVSAEVVVTKNKSSGATKSTTVPSSGAAAAAESAKSDFDIDEGREVDVVKTAEEGGAAWRYSFGVSNGNWAKPRYDDSGWKEGKGMFVDGGYLMTDDRFVRVIRGKKTKWESDQIWLRQAFAFNGKSRQDIVKVTLRYFVWGATQFYLNGEKVATSTDGGNIHQTYNRGYVEFDITEQAKKLLKIGKDNVLAVHSSNSSGGRSYWIRYVDAGLSITTR